MRPKLVAGNWKMNLTYPEGLALVTEIATLAGPALAAPGAPRWCCACRFRT